MAGAGPIHRLPAEVKLAGALAFVVVVAVTPRSALPVLAVQGVAIVAVAALARLPVGFVLRRLAVVVPFLVAAALLAVVGRGPPHGRWGPCLCRSAGLRAGAAIGAKTVIGALTSIVVAGTTPLPDLLAGLGRLGCRRRWWPWPASPCATSTWRPTAGPAPHAMTARGYRPRRLTQAGPMAASLGTTFVRTYERGERVHAAMLSRGYTGTLPAA